ncbi:hypothetical protein PG994_008552 [Apiospora phragmitis]|uniref:Secreted protein n=1 Tax=Apiospora phragmitis TaxID=2905665 RepID=A0ABR1UGS9_9PEZI
MKLFTVVVIGLSTLVAARSIVFQPEITGVPTINGHKIISNSSLPDGIAIHDHGSAICPEEYDSPALPQYIRDGIDYLHRKSDCTAGVRPGLIFCQRVSCSYNSGIYVCNEGDQFPVSPPCGIVADYAQLIKDRCDKTTMGQHITQGQVFDTYGGYYVSVGYGDC